MNPISKKLKKKKKNPQIQNQTHGSFDLGTRMAWVCCLILLFLSGFVVFNVLGFDFVVFWVCYLQCLPGLFSTVSSGFVVCCFVGIVGL